MAEAFFSGQAIGWHGIGVCWGQRILPGAGDSLATKQGE
jgi:hypothetical protein